MSEAAMLKNLSMENGDTHETPGIAPQPSESALRHANLKLAALRAENAAMKKNIRLLMQELARLELGAQNDAIMKTVA